MISGSGTQLDTGGLLFLDTRVGVCDGTGAGIFVLVMGGVPEMEDNGKGDRPGIIGGFQYCTQNASKSENKQLMSP